MLPASITNYAARVYIDLRSFIPIVYARFGRTKQRSYAEVADNDPTWGIHYCPTTAYYGCQANDIIKTNYTRVFSTLAPQDGLFVSLHEFGHGYQYYAVEPWATGSNGCSDESHGWTETENIGCAMVEGFADFIAMLGAGTVIVTSPYGGDHGLENNLDASGQATNPPAAGDGVRVEAAVAAFLYDMVDGESEPDGPTNQPGPSEQFDSLSASAGWLLDIMKYCRLNGQPLQLSGPDQLVYCIEGSTSAYSVASTYSAAWRSYTSVSYKQSLPSYSQSLIRKLWKYNMYGVQ